MHKRAKIRFFASGGLGMLVATCLLAKRGIGPAAALASRTADAVGLSLFFENGRIQPITLIGDAPTPCKRFTSLPPSRPRPTRRSNLLFAIAIPRPRLERRDVGRGELASSGHPQLPLVHAGQSLMGMRFTAQPADYASILGDLSDAAVSTAIPKLRR